jgi:histidine triad (HIT) family protein
MATREDCIFCKIVNGQIPASVILEDEYCLAFMDIFPVKEGHCLLIPKKHYENLLDVDLSLLAKMSSRLAELTRKVNKALKPDGILTAAANGIGAGQDVPHLHFHIIPRDSGDEFGFHFPKGYREKQADRSELDQVASRIKKA